jgi:undecaprenyl-phosphate galactose phosphotransferase
MIGNQPKFKYTFMAIDFSVIFMSFIISVTFTIPNFWFEEDNIFHFYYSYLSLLIVLSIIYIISFLYNDLYKRNIILSSQLQLFLILKALIFAGGISIILMAIYNVDFLAWRGKNLLIMFWLLNLISFTIFRILFSKKIYNLLAKKKIYQRNILIIGGEKAGLYVYKALKRDPLKDFQIIGFLDDYKETHKKIYKEHRNLGKLKDLKNIIHKEKINEIIIAIDDMPYKRLVEILNNCFQICKIVRIYSNFLDVVTKKIRVEQYSDIPVVVLSQYNTSDIIWRIKHCLDKIFAAILIIILFPLFLAISIGIKISSNGPIIFKQIRIGKNGKPFTFYKFRSMHMHNDDSEHKEFVKNIWFKKGEKNKIQDTKIFRIKNDSRVFTFGKFLRKSSIDELPQLLNVIKGDMGLVGPRPCLPFEWDMFEEWHKNRFNTLPGCTGLYQTLGRATVSFEEMVILDLYYISNMTLLLDLKIIIKTIPVILFGKGGF